MSCTKVTDAGIAYLKGNFLWTSTLLTEIDVELPVLLRVICGFWTLLGLRKLTHLNLEGCPVTAACLEFISGLFFILPSAITTCQVTFILMMFLCVIFFFFLFVVMFLCFIIVPPLSLFLFKILTISKKGINKPNTIFFF